MVVSISMWIWFAISPNCWRCWATFHMLLAVCISSLALRAGLCVGLGQRLRQPVSQLNSISWWFSGLRLHDPWTSALWSKSLRIGVLAPKGRTQAPVSGQWESDNIDPNGFTTVFKTWHYAFPMFGTHSLGHSPYQQRSRDPVTSVDWMEDRMRSHNSSFSSSSSVTLC